MIVRKRLAIAIIFIIVLSLGAAIYRSLYYSNTDDRRNDNELLQAITKEFPNFTSNNKPVIEIESVSRYEDNWYVITIKSVEEVKKFVPVKILLYDRDDKLDIILGPDVHFSKYQTLLYDLPESVIIDLEEK